MAFVFRLQPVLEMRRREQDRLHRVVARRLAEIAGIRREIAMLQAQIDANTEDLRRAMGPGAVDVLRLTREKHWLGSLRSLILNQEGRLRTALAELAGERAALAEAAKNVRVIEKFREVQLEQFHLKIRRLEQEQADETALIKFNRARLSQGKGAKDG